MELPRGWGRYRIILPELEKRVMHPRRSGPSLLLAVVALALACPAFVFAQTTDDNTATPGGVLISPEGVLRKTVFGDPNGQLTSQRVAAAKSSLPAEVRSYSKLRKISLVRLERALVQNNGVPTDEMKCLAGLLRVRYVFVYPEQKEIVLAGPAEGWYTDPAGRIVGLNSHRPIVQLQDLAVALRAYAPGANATKVIGCSIDPSKEGLAAMQQFLRSTGGMATPNQTDYIVQGLRSSLGLHSVTIKGVSPKTNVARILVEADYRMKLIGIGLERPPVRMVNFVDKANPSQLSRNALIRWYFVPDYQCVRATEDGLAMEMVGEGVKLVGEDELVAASGERQSVGQGNKASLMFVTSFTKKYAELADRSPVYAELRNVIDLSVVAAFMQQHDYYGKAGWSMPFLGDEKSYAVEIQPAPKQVESAVNAIWRGNRLSTPIAGGVHIDARNALKSENQLTDEKGAVAGLRQELKLPEGRWWWD
jgi:hypothetical protein